MEVEYLSTLLCEKAQGVYWYFSALIIVTLQRLTEIARFPNIWSGSKMANFEDLPVEVVAKILHYLPAKAIAQTSHVCRKFNNATKIPYLWQHRCRADFNVAVTDLNQAEELYKKVFYKYAKILGVWHSDRTPYGRVFEIKCSGEQIVGIDIKAPNSVTAPLLKKPAFCVELLEGKVVTWCLQGRNGKHLGSIQICKTEKFRTHIPPETNFTWHCLIPSNHRHPDGMDAELRNFMRNEMVDQMLDLPVVYRHMHHSQLMKYLIQMEEDTSPSEFWKFHISMPDFDTIIKPGLFLGTYATHGLEIVLLEYKDSGRRISASKITGDPNIPAGKVTIRADLSCHMFLNESVQETTVSLGKIKPALSSIPYSDVPSPQPFRVPIDCIERYDDIPNECLYRFHGFGQIAARGYQNSSFSEGHWIVFNKDMFAFLWLELMCVSVYQRIPEFP